MPKRKTAATNAATNADADETDLVDVWFPIFEAHVLLAIAHELEDDELYFERAKALIAASRQQVDLALEVIEKLLGTGKRRRRKQTAQGE